LAGDDGEGKGRKTMKIVPLAVNPLFPQDAVGINRDHAVLSDGNPRCWDERYLGNVCNTPGFGLHCPQIGSQPHGAFELDGSKCRDCDTQQIKSTTIAVAPAYACVCTCGVAPGDTKGVLMSDLRPPVRNAHVYFDGPGRSVTLLAPGGYEGYGPEDVR
jgi:hypothetical protein